MGRRKKIKREPLTKIDRDVNRQEVRSRVVNLLARRTYGMSPFPFTKEEIYNRVWGESAINAMSVLPKDAFIRRHQFRFRILQPVKDVFAYIECETDAPVIVYCDGQFMDSGNLSAEDANAVLEWVALRRRCVKEEADVGQAVTALLLAAVTYGQLKAFWPTFGTFMPATARAHFQTVRPTRASESLLHAWSQKTTMSPKEVDAILCEALMFDGMEPDDSFRLFSS